MDTRILHKVESYVELVSVASSFAVKIIGDWCNFEQQVLTALNMTINAIPVLACVITRRDGLIYIETKEYDIKQYLEYSIEEIPIPLDKIAVQLSNEARRIVDVAVSLFKLKAIQYSNGLLFYLVINHAITDGPSMFAIVDTFLQFLGSIMDTTFVLSVPASTNRDLIGELLQDSRCYSETDYRFNVAHDNILKFPRLVDSNMDSKNNGCIRLLHRELCATVTSGIIHSCKKHGVSVQALLSAVGALSFFHLLQSSGVSSDLLWNNQIMLIAPVNMRRYLSTSTEYPLERITAQGSVSYWWKVNPFRSEAFLSQRLFWSDYILNEAHLPILDGLNSSYLHQSLLKGEQGSPAFGSLPYSVMVTSMGNISILKKNYGLNVVLEDIIMQAGLCAKNQFEYDNPIVPNEAIENGASGEMWLHAYTVFGCLKLTGEYYGYSEEYVKLYYDEIIRILIILGSHAISDNDELRVGDLFK